MFGIPEWALGVGFIILFTRVIVGTLRGSGMRGRLGRRGMAQSDLDLPGRSEEMEDMRRRLDEMDEVQRRLTELEERVDFTERLLAQQRDAERIAPPKH